MKTALIIFAIIGGVVLVALAIRAALPRTTQADRTLRLAVNVPMLFGQVADSPGQAGWRRDIAGTGLDINK